MQKKAQQNQMFIYIFSLIAAGLIMLFGYYAVKEFGNLSNEARLSDFSAEMVRQTKALNYGDKKILDFIMPSSIKEICFIDVNGMTNQYSTSKSTPQSITGDLKSNYLIIANEIEDALNKKYELNNNFYLLDNNGRIELAGYIPNIVIAGPNWLCKPLHNNNLHLTLTGVSDGVSFADFEKSGDIPITGGTPLILSLDEIVEGLELEVPPQQSNGYITFSINPNTENSGTAKIKITTEKKVWDEDKPLILKIPLKMLNCKRLSAIECCMGAKYRVDIQNDVEIKKMFYVPGDKTPHKNDEIASPNKNSCEEVDTKQVVIFLLSET